MGFMDELKKLTQPYEDEDDFFEGADVSFKPQPKAEAQPKTGTAGGKTGTAQTGQYDENGEELPMKVGKTFIQIVDNEQPVVVYSNSAIAGAKAL